MLLLGIVFFPYGGFGLLLAHVLTLGTLLEQTGRHFRKSPHWDYCVIHWVVAVASIVFLEQTLKFDGFYAPLMWEAGQLCSAGAATVYSCSISRQLQMASI